MKNGWTGGQYSLVRVVTGLLLAVQVVRQAPHLPALFGSHGLSVIGDLGPVTQAPFPTAFALLAGLLPAYGVGALTVLAAGLLASGLWDRPAALVLAGVLTGTFLRPCPSAVLAALLFGGSLLIHALLPRRPFGSLAALGRADPAGDWRFPAGLFSVVWILLATSHAYHGVRLWLSAGGVEGWRLASGVSSISLGFGLILDVVFVPLALWRPARPSLWVVALVARLVLATLAGEGVLGWLLLFALAFDPAWIPAKSSLGVERLFYDGDCGLCHRAVRFVLAEDRSASLRFARLGGESFQERVPEALVAALPDSLVLQRDDGRLLTRSEGALHVGARLGGLWRLLAVLSQAVPRSIRDRVYDGVARLRHHLFRRPKEACPLIPNALRDRFES